MEHKAKEFMKNLEDTHLGLSIADSLRKSRKGSTINDSKKEMSSHAEYKKGVERLNMGKRAEHLTHTLLDAVEIRASELLSIPYDKLIGLTIKTMPKKLDITTKTFTFLDMANECSAFDDAEDTQAVEPE